MSTQSIPDNLLIIFVFQFVFILGLPPLIRFVDLRRPAKSILFTIVLGIICGLDITVSSNVFFSDVIQLTIPPNGQLPLLIVSVVYSYVIMRIGYGNYYSKKPGKADKEQGDRDRAKRFLPIFTTLSSLFLIFTLYSFENVVVPRIKEQAEMNKQIAMLKEAAKNTAEEESPAVKILNIFMNTEEPMTKSQVESIYPYALKAQGGLLFSAKIFERWAYVTLIFTDNVLFTVKIMFSYVFSGEASEDAYRKNHLLIEKEYGVFSEPVATSDSVLTSEKKIGKILIKHVLTKDSDNELTERVWFHRGKARGQPSN